METPLLIRILLILALVAVPLGQVRAQKTVKVGAGNVLVDPTPSAFRAANGIGTGSGDMLLGTSQNVTGAKSFDDGTMILKGATSGTITLKAAGTAGTNTATFAATTGTVVLKDGSGNVTIGGVLTAASLSTSAGGSIGAGLTTGGGVTVGTDLAVGANSVLHGTLEVDGAATALKFNKITITSPATGATFTLANGKTLTVSNTLTFTGTDSSSVALGAGGTVAYAANKLSAFAATSSAELAGVLSDESGTGAFILAGGTPTFTGTPALADATATTLATSGSLTVGENADITGWTSITTGDDNTVGLTIVGNTFQAANLLEVKDSMGGVMAAIEAGGGVTAPVFTGALTGNASTATALAAGRTIGMTGDVTWTSASFNGTGNVTGTSTIGASTVTSSMIVNGTIVNADISGSAAIDASKIAGLATSATTDTTNASNISSGTLGFARMPELYGRVSGSNWTSSSSSYSDVTGLSFAVGASDNWTADAVIYCQGTNANGLRFKVTGPTVSSVLITISGRSSASTPADEIQTAFAATPATSFLSGSGSAISGTVRIHIVSIGNGANSGTIQIQANNQNNSGTCTIFINSDLLAHKTN